MLVVLLMVLFPCAYEHAFVLYVQMPKHIEW